MTDQSNQHEVSDGGEQEVRGKKTVSVRLWPAVVIALIHIVMALTFNFVGSTNVENGMALGLPPLTSMILFVLWWLLFSRVPIWSRLLGVVVFSISVALIVYSQNPRWLGGIFIAIAMPYIVLGSVFVLLATYRVRWSRRRWLLAAYVLGCAAVVFCAVRVESLGGDLVPVWSWRWVPTQLERSKGMVASEGGGTAELPPSLSAGDWPDFRGVRRDGLLEGVSFTINDSKPPREVWRRKIGPGWSSFIGVGDYVFTQEQRGEKELVTCYEAATGKPVWESGVEALFDSDSMGLGPRGTPAYSEGKLYTQGCTGILQALDATTGAQIWERDLKKDADKGVPMYGFCSSPLVVGDLVMVFTGGGDGKCIIAYDRATGKEAWRGGTLGGGYCSPVLEVVQGIPQVIIASSSGLEAYVPETGETLWDHRWKSNKYARCVQPFVQDEELVLIPSTAGTGSQLVRVKKNGAEWTTEEVWTNPKYRPYFNNGVLHEGHYYGYDGERPACLDVETGERLWRGEQLAGQLLLIADMDMLLVLSEKGEVVFIPAVPDGFSVTARFQALNRKKTWNHPIIAHGKLFVRNAEEAACFELAATG